MFCTIPAVLYDQCAINNIGITFFYISIQFLNLNPNMTIDFVEIL